MHGNDFQDDDIDEGDLGHCEVRNLYLFLKFVITHCFDKTFIFFFHYVLHIFISKICIFLSNTECMKTVRLIVPHIHKLQKMVKEVW